MFRSARFWHRSALASSSLTGTYILCGVPIAAIAADSAVAIIVDAAVRGRAFQIHLCNAYTLSLIDKDDRLRDALVSADLNLPDGTPVAWFGRRYGVPGPVRGPSLVRDVVHAGIPLGLAHYFYGGAEGVAEEVTAHLSDHAPGIRIAGLEMPPYRDLDDAELGNLAARIVATGAQIVWIGLGTPRQDYLVPRLAALVDIVVIPVGAAFDFMAGRVEEAPKILHGTGLEWLHRLRMEPRRLWRRYLIGNPRFLMAAARRGRRGPSA